MRFGDVDQSGSELLMENYSIKSMTSSVLLFKENTEEPADVIKVMPGGPVMVYNSVQLLQTQLFRQV